MTGRMSFPSPAKSRLILSRRIRLWQLDPSDLDTPLPFKTCFSFHTGHTANIFNAQFLSQSLDVLATCAGDEQVRIFDLSRVTSLASSSNPSQTKRSFPSTNLPCERVLSCHRGPVKRISTEETNRHFLTVAEVRFHGSLLCRAYLVRSGRYSSPT
jgi:WD40 repeat protein